MKIIISLLMLFMPVLASSIHAQSSEEMTAAERKAIQEKLDSIMFVQAEKAIIDRDFTLEADKVESGVQIWSDGFRKFQYKFCFCQR